MWMGCRKASLAGYFRAIGKRRSLKNGQCGRRMAEVGSRFSVTRLRLLIPTLPSLHFTDLEIQNPSLVSFFRILEFKAERLVKGEWHTDNRTTH
jgi:hypothetical protein